MDHAQSSPETGHAVPNGVHESINGDKLAELIVKPDAGGLAQKLNGTSSTALSPSADSPATPVSSGPPPNVKIDLDYPEQESDVRNEPIDIKDIDAFDKQDPTAVVSQFPASVEQSHITPSPVHDDVNMDDNQAYTNGVHHNGDVNMNDDHAPPPLSADASMATDPNSPAPYTPRERPNSGDEADGQPPAKRARMHFEGGQGSMTHSATPPPASAAVSHTGSPIPLPQPSTAATATSMASASTAIQRTSTGPSSISMQQLKYCQSCVRSLKKLKDAIPFLKPVDAVALNIPHYPTIIKHPMDFSTVERKLNSSNPAKPDPNPENPRYYSIEDFVTDVRLIFSNCLTFNGPDHVVSQMGKRVEEVFDKHIKGMPPATEVGDDVRSIVGIRSTALTQPKAAPPPKKATPPPPPPDPVVVPAPPKKAPAPRRPSTSVPVIRRNDAPEPISRPKREIHPPAPKDLPYADVPKKNRKAKRLPDDGTAEQLKFCSKLVQEFHKKQYYTVAHPFYEPVDWMRLDLPDYPKIIKRPMDLSTMKRKLENQDYPNPQKFMEDFRLMIRNCLTYNGTASAVSAAAQQLQKLFDEKMKSLPPLRPQIDDDDSDDDDDDDSEAERQRVITMIESQIETLKGNLEALKNPARHKEKKKKKKEKERDVPPPPAPSKSAPKPSKSAPKKKSSSKKVIADDDVLTFEQKKDLSETIGKLDGAKLEKVINIIHEGVPEIRDSTEEIELEIDLLPAAVLTKLYNFVIRPLKQTTVKRNRTGKGTGTGGLKRKSMDEDVEAEKIRQLEQRMALFNQGPSVSAPVPARRVDSDHSSDSSSGSDSSGSDSE